jgi:hypothetical protein
VNLGQLVAGGVPDLSDSEVTDLVLLRKEYGIGAEEAWTRLPAWEVELLCSAVRPPDGSPMDEGDPFEAPPEDLQKLLDREE